MNVNENMREFTNNKQFSWKNEFLARENRVIEKVAEYKSALADLNMAAMDRIQANCYFGSIRRECRARRNEFNQAIKDGNNDEIYRLLKLKNHGCTTYFDLTQHIIDYYTKGSGSDQFEELGPELIEYPAPDPDPYC